MGFHEGGPFMLAASHIDPTAIFQGQCTLPPIPEVVNRVQEILEDNEIDVDEVAELMNGDPALVSRVLKIVNSACYSLQRKVVDVKFAIGFLGLEEIHGIMMSFSVAKALDIKNKAALSELWFHAFHTALFAQYLAKKNGARKPPKALWSAALLHDIGKLVYMKFFPNEFTKLKNHAQEKGCLFSTAESELGLPSSAYLGTLLCDYWKLPFSARSACESHTLESLRDTSLIISEHNIVGLVTVCNLVSSLVTETFADGFSEEIIRETKQALDYDQPAFDSLISDAEVLKADAEVFMHHIC
jgi:HD-like signal output (HDOD) protein